MARQQQTAMGVIGLALGVFLPGALGAVAHSHQTGSIHIAAMHKGPDPATGSWSLKFEPPDKLTVRFEGTQRAIQVPAAQRDDLARLVRQAAFFSLKESYGTPVIAGAVRDLEVRIGHEGKHVFLYESLAGDSNREEVKRALKVWIAVRSLFEIEGALDSRKEDRMLMDSDP
jgi:hypothetical protein